LQNNFIQLQMELFSQSHA